MIPTTTAIGTGFRLCVYSRRPPASKAAMMDDLAAMGTGAAIAVGAGIGLVIGIVVSVATDVPLAPEVGLILGGLAGWFARRDRA
jgi:hypothetical protein